MGFTMVGLAVLSVISAFFVSLFFFIGAVVCGEYPNGAPVNVPKTTGRATKFDRDELEDETVKH